MQQGEIQLRTMRESSVTPSASSLMQSLAISFCWQPFPRHEALEVGDWRTLALLPLLMNAAAALLVCVPLTLWLCTHISYEKMRGCAENCGAIVDIWKVSPCEDLQNFAFKCVDW